MKGRFAFAGALAAVAVSTRLAEMSSERMKKRMEGVDLGKADSAACSR
jgi:hypothetical protein